MKIRSILTFLFAALIFASCAKNEGNGPDDKLPIEGNKKSVYLKLSGMRNSTRSDESSAIGEKAILASAALYFTDGSADPVVYAVRTVGTASEDILLTDLLDGVLVDGIPTQVEQVYVIGNYNSVNQSGVGLGIPTSIGITLSQLKATLVNLNTIAYPQVAGGALGTELLTLLDGIADVLPYNATNSGQWTGTNTPSADDLFANVTISPINARLELNRIRYEGNFKSLVLDGIFINYFYDELPISLNITGATLVNNGSEGNNYTFGNAAFKYTNYPTMYDRPQITLLGNNSVAEPANGTWAYHLFGNQNPVSHIVLRFTDVTTQDDENLGTRYLTIQGFADSGSQPLASFQRGKLYDIPLLTFNDSNLELIPEPDTEPIWVNVEVLAWDNVTISPIL